MSEDLESIKDIAERDFAEEVAEINERKIVPHIDSDRLRENLWYKECQESRKNKW